MVRRSLLQNITGRQGLTNPNGYYTWARLGFDGSLRKLMSTRARLKNSELNAVAADFYQKFPNVKNVSELMMTKKGRTWWKAYGGYFEGTFKLSDGSVSHRVLTKYAREKQNDSRRKSLSSQSNPEWLDDPIRTLAGVDSDDSRHVFSPGGNQEWNPNQGAETTPLCEEPDPLSPEDEEILDRVWDEIARERELQGRRGENDFEIEDRSPDVVS